MDYMDFDIKQISIRYEWDEVIGNKVKTNTSFGGLFRTTSNETITKKVYQVIDAETKEVIESNTKSNPPFHQRIGNSTFTYSSDSEPKILTKMLGSMLFRNANGKDYCRTR